MPYNPGVNFIGGQLMGQGINAAAHILSEDTLKALQRYDETKKEAEFNDATVEQLKKYVPAEQLQRYHTMSGSQKTGVAMAAIRGATFDMQKELKDSQTGEASARQNLLEAQAHNEWSGTDGAGGFTPTADVLDRGHAVGKDWLPNSAKSGQWVDMPDAPDLGADGNPVYSKDGTMYRSGGQMKPVTAPMLQAHIYAEADRKAKEIANSKPPDSGWSVFKPSTWLSGKKDATTTAAAATPATGATPPLPTDPGMTAGATPLMPDTQKPVLKGAPVKVNTPQEASALPAGTRYQTPDGKIFVR